MDKTNLSLPFGTQIIIGLTCLVVFLTILAVSMYFYMRSRNSKKNIAYKELPPPKPKPKLKISIPDKASRKVSKKPQFLIPPAFVKDDHLVKTPDTPLTPSPNSPFTPTTPYAVDNAEGPFKTSASNLSENVFVRKDRDVDGLWKLAVKKATASQFFANKQKGHGKVSFCANGKIKFLLSYNQHGQKELTVKVLEFIDLPLSREIYSVPFVKVYLYPQSAHNYPVTDVIKSGFRVETMCFPRENNCSYESIPFDKLSTLALKFVILDYDRFSRSEFVADCVVQLDEVSLEGEPITRHLSIQRVNQEKDLGSLLVSLCYQPTLSRMCIMVLKASGLPDDENGHIPDFFIKISLMRNGSVLDKRRTKTIKKSVCPVFNESLTFPVDCNSVRTLVLVFDVIRYDSKIKQEKIATVILGNHIAQRQVTPHEIQHFNEVLTTPQRQIAEWHKLIE